MVKSMYAAISGLKVHQSKLDVISNNIANVNTWGYKTKSANFSDSMYQNSIQGGEGNFTAGGVGGMNTSQLGFGVNMSSISTDYTTGSWNPTGNGLHCMINGSSFFIVSPYKDTIQNVETDGASLSRVGIFSVDSNGFLVDDQGNYVFGYACTNVGQSISGYDADGRAIPAPASFDTAALAPLRIPSADEAADVNEFGTINNGGGRVSPTSTAERANIQSYSIGTDGTIIGVAEDSSIYTIGKIAVASVQNPNGLEQNQGYLYEIGPNAGTVTHTEAGTGAVGSILSGYLEMSNTDLANEIASMITTQRGYQANTKIITVTDEMLAELVNMKR